MSSEYRFSPVIGIISYFPDDLELKKTRIARMNNLFKQIDIILNVPIMVIAQNWKGISLQEGTTRQPIIIHNYKEGLGINKARQTLREKFLESEFNYLIMLDDDSQLAGTPEGGRIYLEQLKQNPTGWMEFKPSLLKLFAISKPMYSMIKIPDGGADDSDPKMRFFEDQYICKSLKKLYSDRQITPIYGKIMELSNSAWDEGNTGWHKVYTEEYDNKKWERHDTGGNTRYMIAQTTRNLLKTPEKLKRRDPFDPKLKKWNDLDSVEKYKKI